MQEFFTPQLDQGMVYRACAIVVAAVLLALIRKYSSSPDIFGPGEQPARVPQWQFESRNHDDWQAMDLKMQGQMESLFVAFLATNKPSRDSINTNIVTSRGFDYHFDFVRMVQVNGKTNRERRIRRQMVICESGLIKWETELNRREKMLCSFHFGCWSNIIAGRLRPAADRLLAVARQAAESLQEGIQQRRRAESRADEEERRRKAAEAQLIQAEKLAEAAALKSAQTEARASHAEHTREQAAKQAAQLQAQLSQVRASAAESEKQQALLLKSVKEDAVKQQVLLLKKGAAAERQREQDKKRSQSEAEFQARDTEEHRMHLGRQLSQLKEDLAKADHRADEAEKNQTQAEAKLLQAMRVAETAALKSAQFEGKARHEAGRTDEAENPLGILRLHMEALRKVAEDNEKMAHALKQELESSIIYGSSHMVSWNPLRRLFPTVARDACSLTTRATLSLRFWPFFDMDEAVLKKRIQDALRATSHQGHSSRCNPMQKAVVQRIERIFDQTLIKNYLRSKQAIREDFEKHGITVGALSPGLPQALTESFSSSVPLDEDVGEQLLFHGTTSFEHIRQQGFDERCAKKTGLYGWGVYFADQACKASQYAKPSEGGLRCIILARVALGDCFSADGHMAGQKRSPPRKVSSGLYGSVVANVGIPNGQPLSTQQHREFVLFDGKHAYPDLAIFFTL
ncbi:unnamed protein product [Polarella glacialis]|uniref:Poly [ADP-ribose] polymerase n=1 Tax=Polarella glacialis TaxID=89957 RepID=A0A813FZ56_POLGL|nr:unnamed protein product [Polarella glacialis]CAE8650067.1 unnamed protein product [Polarella glacialis]